MMATRDDVIIAAAACVILNLNKNSKRKCWVRPSLLNRKKYSGSNLLDDLRRDDSLSGELRCDGSFKNFLRMSSANFEFLINLVGHKICKQDTNFRDSIPVKERLAITLRFLATGDSFHSLMYLFKVSKQVISNIVPEVCDALVESLQEYIKVSLFKNIKIVSYHINKMYSKLILIFIN